MATNTGMLRGTGLREKRESIDTGTGVQRTAGNAQREEIYSGRGNFMNFYEDLGISATQPVATAIRNDEATFQKNKKDQEANLAAARANYNAAMGQITGAEGELAKAYESVPGLSTAVQNSWNTFKSSLTPVRVVDPSGTKVEATYYVPREAAESVVGKEGLYTSWEENGTFLNVTAKNNNQQVHDIFRTAANTMEYSYKEKAAQELAQSIAGVNLELGSQSSQLAGAKAQVESYGAQVSNAEGQLAATVAQRQAEWDALHGKYNTKIDTMNSILAGVKVQNGK